MIKNSLRVALVISNLHVGGAERLLVDMVSVWRQRSSPIVPYVYAFGDGPIRRELEAQGCFVSISPETFRINPLLVPWLVKSCRRDKIQLLHLHLPRAGFYGRFAAKLLNLPVLYTEHSLWESHVPFSRFLNRITYFLNNHVVAVSDAVLNSIRNHSHYPSGRLTRIYNGIPLYNDIQSERRFELRQNIGLHERTIIAGAIANLNPRKGIQFFLYALHHLLEEFPNLHCVIIGRDDGEKAKLRRIVTQLGIENHIHWLGYRSDARHLLPMFDVFVLPSLVEGLPIALLEAMDAGLPVIATRVGGTPEVVVNGETGILVDPADVPALAISLRSLLVDSHKREQMGVAGRRRVREEFTIDRMAKRYAELYFNLLH